MNINILKIWTVGIHYTCYFCITLRNRAIPPIWFNTSLFPHSTTRHRSSLCEVANHNTLLLSLLTSPSKKHTARPLTNRILYMASTSAPRGGGGGDAPSTSGIMTTSASMLCSENQSLIVVSLSKSSLRFQFLKPTFETLIWIDFCTGNKEGFQYDEGDCSWSWERERVCKSTFFFIKRKKKSLLL